MLVRIEISWCIHSDRVDIFSIGVLTLLTVIHDVEIPIDLLTDFVSVMKN